MNLLILMLLIICIFVIGGFVWGLSLFTEDYVKDTYNNIFNYLNKKYNKMNK